MWPEVTPELLLRMAHSSGTSSQEPSEDSEQSLDSPTRRVVLEYSDIQTKGPPGRSFRDMELELVASVHEVTPFRSITSNFRENFQEFCP